MMNIAHVTHTEGEDHLTLDIELNNEKKHFNRELNEKLDRLVSRLQLFALNEHKQKEAHQDDTASIQNTSPSMQVDQIAVNFLREDGKEIEGDNLLVGDVLKKCSSMRLGTVDYVVVKNQHRILQLSTLEPVMVGVPIVPIVNLEFCTTQDCDWVWMRKCVSDDSLTQCSQSPFYVPIEDDIGKHLILKCGVPTQVGQHHFQDELEYQTSVVRYGPNRDVFSPRKRLTSESKPTSSIRVMSYNILYNGYTTKEPGHVSVFPYTTPSFLNEHYRLQLVLLEIQEMFPDIVCLQEVGMDVYHTILLPVLQLKGYFGTIAEKTGTTREGCAIFYKQARFQVIESHVLDISALLTAPTQSSIQSVLQVYPEIAKCVQSAPSIAQVLLLQYFDESASQEPKYLVVSNTHLFYRDDAHMCRLLQTLPIVYKIQDIMQSEAYKNELIGVIMSGDYNSLPATAPVSFLLSGSIDQSHRDWGSAKYFKWKQKKWKKKNERNLNEMNGFKRSFKNILELMSACGCPEFTNYVENFNGTLDYIFISKETLEVVQTFPMFTKEQVTEEVALPSSIFPSDHISLLVDVAFHNGS
uniref:2' putative n=1 Tax=Albugo laibachii Nc14 TaxID=890382 RepID=F0WIH2_9STRA|nr:2' putative [Albugo laibachii Nc14]|eukprot:CCA21054.1 2' putative [Albugo laibachii Nc14]